MLSRVQPLNFDKLSLKTIASLFNFYSIHKQNNKASRADQTKHFNNSESTISSSARVNSSWEKYYVQEIYFPKLNYFLKLFLVKKQTSSIPKDGSENELTNKIHYVEIHFKSSFNKGYKQTC